jgi:hypothetical protein
VCIEDGSGLNFKLDQALINVFLFFFDNPNFEKESHKKISKITQIYATNTFFSEFLGQKRKH